MPVKVAPLMEMSVLKVTESPPDMVILLKVMVPVPELETMLVPPKVVVLFPAFKVPVPLRLKSPVMV